MKRVLTVLPIILALLSPLGKTSGNVLAQTSQNAVSAAESQINFHVTSVKAVLLSLSHYQQAIQKFITDPTTKAKLNLLYKQCLRNITADHGNMTKIHGTIRNYQDSVIAEVMAWQTLAKLTGTPSLQENLVSDISLTDEQQSRTQDVYNVISKNWTAMLWSKGEFMRPDLDTATYHVKGVSGTNWTIAMVLGGIQEATFTVDLAKNSIPSYQLTPHEPTFPVVVTTPTGFSDTVVSAGYWDHVYLHLDGTISPFPEFAGQYELHSLFPGIRWYVVVLNKPWPVNPKATDYPGDLVLEGTEMEAAAIENPANDKYLVDCYPILGQPGKFGLVFTVSQPFYVDKYMVENLIYKNNGVYFPTQGGTTVGH